MAYVERTDEEIIAAYERWVYRLSEADQNKAIMGCLCPPPKKNTWTPKDLIDAMKSGDEHWRAMPEHFRKLAKMKDEDIVSIIDSWPAQLQ
jgi:hypothetical protein